MYLTYDEYDAMGGTQEEEIFMRLEMRARGYIDRMTHGRLRGETPVREGVKHAMYWLIRAMAEEETHAGRVVQALTNDGVGIRYAPGADGARYAAILRDYLSGEKAANGVGLMYAGVDA